MGALGIMLVVLVRIGCYAAAMAMAQVPHRASIASKPA